MCYLGPCAWLGLRCMRQHRRLALRVCVWRRVRRLGGVVLCLAVCTGRPTYVLDLLRQGGARMCVVCDYASRKLMSEDSNFNTDRFSVKYRSGIEISLLF